MSFGLTNAPTILTMLMDSVIHPCIGNFIVAFLDDILIFSHFNKEILEHKRMVFKFLCKHKLYIEERKCEFLLI